MSDTSTDQMKGFSCPNCHAELVMSSRQGVEIDYCPVCRGVWLDRGELDKIIERSMVETTKSDGRSFGGEKNHGGHGRHGYRRKSWLHEIFD